MPENQANLPDFKKGATEFFGASGPF